MELEIFKNKIPHCSRRYIMLDIDLGELFGVENRARNYKVKRSINRLPDDLLLELNDREIEGLLSQSVISKLLPAQTLIN